MSNRLSRVALAVTLAAGLSACVSIDGPAPVVNSQRAQAANDKYINGDVLGPFYSPDASQRGGFTALQWRNAVVGAQLDAADQNYAAYVKALRSEKVSFALVSDLAALGLSSGAALAAKTTANALSAASGGIVAANATINKDVYYNATVEALIAQMDADRATVRAKIEKAKQSNEVAYPLESALGDVRLYESAGRIDRAITKLTVAASAASDAATANLDLVRDSSFVAAEPPAAKLLDRIDALTDAQALTVLNAMKPKLSERSATFRQNLKAIIPGLDGIADGATAKSALRTWITLDDRTPDFQKEWSDALDAATK